MLIQPLTTMADAKPDPVLRTLLAMSATTAQIFYAKQIPLLGQVGQTRASKAAGDALREVMAICKQYCEIARELKKLSS
jgi:hypothetical protein